MRPLISKLKPANGFSKLAYLLLNCLLPVVIYILVTMDFVLPALTVILLSKWRMLAVRIRFWPANIRANAVDIIVGVSLMLFMVETGSQIVRLGWVLVYILWLIVLKPASGSLTIPLQALAAMSGGLIALFLSWGNGPLYALVLLSGTICYLSARHFFDSFDEPYAKMLSYLWAYFAASLVWVLGHWLLYYAIVSQPALLLIAIGFGLAALYYLDHHDKLSGSVQKQITFILVAIILIVLIFSGWNDKIV